MKLIRLLVTMALVNAVGVVVLVGFGFHNPPVPTASENRQTAPYAPGLELTGFPSPVVSAVPVVSAPTSARSTSSAPASPRVSTTVSPSAAASVVPTPTPAVPSPTPTPTLTPTPTPTPQSNRCIVQIDGVSYDVTTLRVTHSGGDIFVCGTDMSRTFWSQHNSRILQKMQQYKI